MDWHCIVFFLVGIHPISSLTEVDLKKNLLSAAVYDQSVRPRRNASHTVQVQLNLQVVYILELKEKESRFSQACYLMVTWMDEFLTWNSSEYGGLESFVTDPASIWTPDVTVYGQMDTGQGVDLSLVRVRSDGKVTSKFVGLLTTHCSVNSAYFPFDYQRCNFFVGSDIYTTSEVIMEAKAVEVFDTAKVNPSWGLDFVKFHNYSQGMCTVEYCLRRKSLYLGVLYMVPTSMHAVLILVTYIVPSDAGEKISFGISLFLSFMVFLLQLNGDLPETSTAIPTLEIFFMLHMSSGVVALIIAAITAYITHNKEQTVPAMKVKTVSTVDTRKKTPLRNLCGHLRSATLLNKAGFVVSFILILAANFVMLNARVVSEGCS